MTRLRFLLAITAFLAFGSAALPAQTPAVDVTGKWAFAVTTENGTGYPTVTLKQEGEKITGTYESQRLGSRAIEGTIKGGTIKFAMKGADGMPDFEFSGVVVDKDNMKGTLEMGGMGSATFTGKRAQ
ncbi:MAG TPA: hypothetical protein VFV33_19465 [Gemmatimonadaceae bacterium]|nr:hypothetical protein [Gemmatimonadaceae bacterium]